MFQNADKPANIREEDSETPWLTSEAIRFMDEVDGPWCAHLSFIKPHWPYIVPAPYHAIYGQSHVPQALRAEAELEAPHPVLEAYQKSAVAQAFQRDDVRRKVIPAYMGLIKQCDDQLGRLLDHLEATGKAEDTMIVLTSDHGDYLGDHWLGEKDFFHEASVKIPLIIYDPRASADGARGTICEALTESIDLAATFVEAAGGKVPDHILEGRSLMPWLRGETPEKWREFVVSEYDYGSTPRAPALGVSARDARIFMVFDGRWKLIHFEGGFRPMLFDLQTDPSEFIDFGEDPACASEIARLYDYLRAWGLRLAQRVTVSDSDIAEKRGKSGRRGILPFLVDGSEVAPELVEKYRGHARQIYTVQPAETAPEEGDKL